MAPIPLTSGPETPPSSPPNLTTPVQAEEGGFCGLTVDQLHLVMIFVVFLLLALLVVVVISWVNDEDICLLLLAAQKRAEMARTRMREELFGHLLSENDVLVTTPGANITPRRYPIVAFLVTLVGRRPGFSLRRSAARTP